MTKFLTVKQDEAIFHFLELFAYAEQKWCDWEQLENAIVEVDYDKFTPEYADWFVEFLANCVLRVWRSKQEDPNLNQVQENDTGFFIFNYDWNAFKFSKQKGGEKELATKNIIAVTRTSLADKEIKWLRSRCK